MATLLNVQSSPALPDSASRAVSDAFVTNYCAANPGTDVVNVDLAQTPPSHIGANHLQAFFAPDGSHAPDAAAALAASDAYVDQLMAADVLVLGSPMHNFGVASTMKSWIDNILRVGRTFQYTETGPVGLLEDRPVVIAVGSGGVYSEGPFNQFEHCGHYLRDILSFIGLRNVHILRAEGLAMGPEAAKAGMAKGTAAAKSLGETLQ